MLRDLVSNNLTIRTTDNNNNTSKTSSSIRHSGLVYRGSEAIEYIFNIRKGELRNDIFVTYKKVIFN